MSIVTLIRCKGLYRTEYGIAGTVVTTVWLVKGGVERLGFFLLVYCTVSLQWLGMAATNNNSIDNKKIQTQCGRQQHAGVLLDAGV